MPPIAALGTGRRHCGHDDVGPGACSRDRRRGRTAASGGGGCARVRRRRGGARRLAGHHVWCATLPPLVLQLGQCRARRRGPRFIAPLCRGLGPQHATFFASPRAFFRSLPAGSLVQRRQSSGVHRCRRRRRGGGRRAAPAAGLHGHSARAGRAWSRAKLQDGKPGGRLRHDWRPAGRHRTLRGHACSKHHRLQRSDRSGAVSPLQKRSKVVMKLSTAPYESVGSRPPRALRNACASKPAAPVQSGDDRQHHGGPHGGPLVRPQRRARRRVASPPQVPPRAASQRAEGRTRSGRAAATVC